MTNFERNVSRSLFGRVYVSWVDGIFPLCTYVRIYIYAYKWQFWSIVCIDCILKNHNVLMQYIVIMVFIQMCIYIYLYLYIDIYLYIYIFIDQIYTVYTHCICSVYVPMFKHKPSTASWENHKEHRRFASCGRAPQKTWAQQLGLRIIF